MTDGLAKLSGVRAAALLALAFVLFMAGGLVLQPDAVRPQSAATQFDANAARERIARVLGDQRPHPVDSAENDAVRERLLGEIRALGFTPEVREHFSCRSHERRQQVDCALARNIVFSIGPDSEHALLAAAHYDSVPAGPGASDDGIGVAAWLEIAARLKNEPLRQRVNVLFTDGEEIGLLGAHAFAESDPLHERTRAIVNLEARGVRGPAIFFETNAPNGRAVRAYAANAPRPLANSVMADIYRMLPNNTDVTELRRDGVDVLNVSIIDGDENYHTPRDTIANQDLRSLQSLGDQGLGVARAFATGDAGASDNLVFTDILSRWFISLPTLVSQIALALCAFVAVFAFWRAPAPRWRALGAPLVALIVAGGLAYAINFGLSAFQPSYWYAHPEYTRAWSILCGLTGVATMLWFARAASSATLAASAALWFALVGVGFSLLAPGATILFLPSAALFAAGALIAIAWRPAALIGASLAAIAALVLWAPLHALFETTLGYEMPYLQAIIVVVALLPCVALLGAGGRWSTAAAAAATAAAVAVAALAPTFSAARPMPLNILYMVDETKQEAHFVAGAADTPLPAPLASAAEFASANVLPWDTAPSWVAPAPYAQAPAANASVVSDTSENGKRIVRLRLEANGAYRVGVRVPRAAQPQGVAINGQDSAFAPPRPDDEFAIFSCWGRACDGAEVAFTLDANARQPEATPWYVTGFHPGAPPQAQALIAARPNTATAVQNGDGLYTLREVATQNAQPN